MKRNTTINLAKRIAKVSLGVAACAAVTLTAYAAVTFDSATGTGFVGKGDVQDVFGWNNEQLQSNAASVQFRINSVTKVTWVCTNSNNQHTQQRKRTTIAQGQLLSSPRVQSGGQGQVTGFDLLGWDGAAVNETDGPPLNSCPNGPWSLTTAAGAPVINSGGMEVSINGTDWFDLE